MDGMGGKLGCKLGGWDGLEVRYQGGMERWVGCRMIELERIE